MNAVNSGLPEPLLPGANLGVIGGGQLGRYFVWEARRLGYHTWVLDPDASAPAMQIAEHALVAAYDDQVALNSLAEQCDAVTVEFENVPAQSLEFLATLTRVAPSANAIRVAQDRALEKNQALKFGLQPVPYAVIESLSDIPAALDKVELPAIIKTSRLGYDGKGQVVCSTEEQVRAAFDQLDHACCVLEHRIDLAAEVSVILARGYDKQVQVFPISRNVHENGILATSLVPSGVDPKILDQATALAIALAEGLDYIGVLAVEFFIDSKGTVLFNEMAPRPHNSGHYTLDATHSSQFEQQLRALCALPLASTELLSPVCMLNLLGDSWGENKPDWHSLMARKGLSLHLYGKQEARPARKMGHVNILSDTQDKAFELARQLHQSLQL
ncbi:MAG: 5-(carboxyamino)imidazole ribonucleotide synthase [Granulosicoccus sp.]